MKVVDEDFFIKNGYVFLRNAFDTELIESWWMPRMRFLNQFQYPGPVSHLYFPVFRRFPLHQKLPKIYAAISQLVGGSDKFADEPQWSDGFTVAMPNCSKTALPEFRSPNYPWHLDGYYRRFLDTSNKGLICIVFWTDSNISNGATAVAKGTISKVAADLQNAPEGRPPGYFDRAYRFVDFDQITYLEASAGDVCFMHPMLIHSVRPNFTKKIRAITNPAVRLKTPFKLNKKNGSYSPVEKTILSSLGKEFIDFRRSAGESFNQDIISDFQPEMQKILMTAIRKFESGL